MTGLSLYLVGNPEDMFSHDEAHMYGLKSSIYVVPPNITSQWTR